MSFNKMDKENIKRPSIKWIKQLPWSILWIMIDTTLLISLGVGLSYIGYTELGPYLSFLKESSSIYGEYTGLEDFVNSSYVTGEKLSNNLNMLSAVKPVEMLSIPLSENVAEVSLYEFVSSNKIKILLTLGLIITIIGINLLMKEIILPKIDENVVPMIANTLNTIVGNTQYENATNLDLISTPIESPASSPRIVSERISDVGVATMGTVENYHPGKILFEFEYVDSECNDEPVNYKTMVSPYDRESLKFWFDGYEFEAKTFNYYAIINDEEIPLTHFKTLSEVLALSDTDYSNWYKSWQEVKDQEDALRHYRLSSSVD